jgi:ATP-dependent Lon protease
MNSTQQFIIALITVLVPVIIPLITTLIFTSQKTRLAKLKAVLDSNKEYVADVIKFAQATFKQMDGASKLTWVLGTVAKKVNLPEDQLKVLVESVLAELQKDFAEQWEKI